MMTNETYSKVSNEFADLFEAYVDEVCGANMGRNQAELNELRAEFVVKQDAMLAKYGTTMEEFEEKMLSMINWECGN
jgi:hypothetical protein